MDRRGQAKLYYLYMMSDGEVSTNEKKLFTTICKEIDVDADAKKGIIKECERIAKSERLNCMEVLLKNIEISYPGELLNIDLSKYVSDSDKAAIIWNLVNLGYADAYFTNAERAIVEFLCEYWEINNSVYQEMIDVAETILSLEKHRKWVEEELTDSETKQEKLKQIKKDIKYAQESIKITITEIGL
ncbi:MAG: hypothetical protein IKL22_04450 [Lachnospiraceae bacterium]|nr:hypothetical protein [Lachnospiraceae bacterium]